VEVIIVSEKSKKAYVSIMSLVGLLFLLLGIFTALDFVIGLIIAIVLWIGSGILGRYWGVKKEKD
jgi:hypothetical protein